MEFIIIPVLTTLWAHTFHAILGNDHIQLWIWGAAAPTPLRDAGYLDSLCGAGPQLPAQDFLENIGKEADRDEQDDGQPGRATR